MLVNVTVMLTGAGIGMKGGRFDQGSELGRRDAEARWPLLVPPHLNVVSDLSREREIKPSRTGSQLFQLPF